MTKAFSTLILLAVIVAAGRTSQAQEQTTALTLPARMFEAVPRGWTYTALTKLRELDQNRPLQDKEAKDSLRPLTRYEFAVEIAHWEATHRDNEQDLKARDIVEALKTQFASDIEELDKAASQRSTTTFSALVARPRPTGQLPYLRRQADR